MTDKTEASLLQAVLRDPDSDDARIAYARWAKEVGDPRWEFIEVQLEEARKHREHTYVADWAPLAARAQKILALYDALWLRPVRQLLDDTVIRLPMFYRGFVEDVEIDARAFVEHAATLYQHHGSTYQRSYHRVRRSRLPQPGIDCSLIVHQVLAICSRTASRGTMAA